MTQSVVLTGMVLTSMPVNDYDKRITILTKERGKITAFARGARRPNSQLIAVTNPFVFGQFELFEGKNSYNLSKASISNYFRELSMDFEAAYMGFYFLEFMEYYCQENNDEKEMLRLLYQSVRALDSKRYSLDFVRVVFEMKALTISGEGPQVFSCMKCRKKEELVMFSVKRGGIFCMNCKDEAPGILISDATRYTMQYVTSSSIEKLYSFQVSDEVLKELQLIMKEYMNHYVHHEFKSLQVFRESV